MPDLAKRCWYVVLVWLAALVLLFPAAPFLSLFPEGSVFFWMAGSTAPQTGAAADGFVRGIWIFYGALTAFTVAHRRTFLLGFAVLCFLLLSNVVGCWVILNGIHD